MSPAPLHSAFIRFLHNQKPTAAVDQLSPKTAKCGDPAVAAAVASGCRYDPVHYSAPEGSYASEPHGAARVRDFRQMVQALHRMGLRVVLDVVYNHTFHSGLDGKLRPLLAVYSLSCPVCAAPLWHCRGQASPVPAHCSCFALKISFRQTRVTVLRGEEGSCSLLAYNL